MDGQCAEYFFDAWGALDFERFGLEVGDCRGQAVWEALAMLVAMRAWSRFWKDKLLAMVIKSDSKAALGAFEKERSRSASINAIAREVSFDLALARFQIQMEYAHVRGKDNEWADALSRLSEPGSGACVPGPLRDLPCAQVPLRDASWWRTDVRRV